MSGSITHKILRIILLASIMSFVLIIYAFAAEPTIVVTKGNPSGITGIPYTIEFYVTDDTGVVSILVNGRELGPNGGTYYDAEWTTYHNGEIVITATDNEGYSTTVTELITNLNANPGGGNSYPVEEDINDEPEVSYPEMAHPIPTQPVIIVQQPSTQPVQPTVAATQPTTSAAPKVEESRAIPSEPATTEAIPETSETEEDLEIETEPEKAEFQYYEIPDSPQSPQPPPVARLNSIAAAAISRGKLFSIKPPKVARLSRILQASIIKGNTFRLKRPSSPNLIKIARMAFNKGRLCRAAIPHAPSILKIASQVLKYAGTEINIPSSADISKIANEAHKKAIGIKLMIPNAGDLSDITQLAADKAADLAILIPKAPDLTKILHLAAEVELSEKDIVKPAFGEYTIISTMTATQNTGFSAPALMLISLLSVLICMEFAIILLHKKSRKLYILFKEAYIKKGGL